MGAIYYGGTETPIYIEDRALAHLKVVIATKLRRAESFTVSWRHPEDQPQGRTTIWLHPSIPLRFVFDDPEPAQLSRQWIEELANSAATSNGIFLLAENIDSEPASNTSDDSADVSLGKVQVDALDVGALTVDGTPVSPGDDAKTPAT
ncbi:hypothetical protein QL996_02945 [Planococcus sp. APC 4015]|nr:hypothetical protein [Planococcus sp. APC 4015]